MKSHSLLAAMAGSVLACALASADIAITVPGYYGAENFDTLANSGTANPWVNNSTIQHWYANLSTYRANHGSDNTGAMYSYGAADSTERALGALSSGTTPLISLGVVMYNAGLSSISLSNILISFTGEQWRQTANAQALVASYRVQSGPFSDTTTGPWTTNNALTFTAPNTGTAGPLDGNLPQNRAFFSNVPVDSSGALNPGEYLMVRWVKTGTTSPGLAIDDFSIRVVPEPASIALAGLGAIAALLARRKRLTV